MGRVWWQPTYFDMGRMITMVANEELLNKIAKMIVDGTVFVPIISRPFIVHLWAGKVKPVIDSVHKFDEVYSMYDTLMTGHVRGKIVIEVM